jgi:hypothetical protein
LRTGLSFAPFPPIATDVVPITPRHHDKRAEKQDKRYRKHRK